VDPDVLLIGARLAEELAKVFEGVGAELRVLSAARAHPGGFAERFLRELKTEPAPPAPPPTPTPAMIPPFVPAPEPAPKPARAFNRENATPIAPAPPRKRSGRGDPAAITSTCPKCKGKTHPSAHAIGKHKTRCDHATDEERAFYRTRGRWPRKDEV
jgi:hypothetical protein